MMLDTANLDSITDHDLEELRKFADFLGWRAAYKRDPEKGRPARSKTIDAILAEQARRREASR
jgi:hypothetical protein